MVQPHDPRQRGDVLRRPGQRRHLATCGPQTRGRSDPISRQESRPVAFVLEFLVLLRHTHGARLPRQTMAAKGSGSLPRILTIARNAFREAVRDRVLYNLILFVLLITASAIFLGELTA